MIFHFIRILFISAVLILCMFLPYLPGEYDSTATTISFIAQVSGFSSILLLPLGIIWILYDLSRGETSLNKRKMEQGFFIATLIILFLVLSIVSLSAFSLGHIFFGLLLFGSFSYGIFLFKRKWYVWERQRIYLFNALAVYIFLIPLIVMLTRFCFIKQATEYGRNMAIKNSESLIRDIEAYYGMHGHYPLSLNSVNKDYHPSVIGIREYIYEPFGKAYNLYFEQLPYHLDSKEIVMYNKLDEHAMTSHKMDILEYSGTALDLRRGDRRRFDLPQAHWKVIWFD